VGTCVTKPGGFGGGGIEGMLGDAEEEDDDEDEDEDDEDEPKPLAGG